MKVELGVHVREIQRDWYGKRGISLHGFYVIAQVATGERVTEVIDLWSEDTTVNKMPGSRAVPWTLASDGWRRHIQTSKCTFSLVTFSK